MSTVQTLVTEPDDLRAPAGCFRIIAERAKVQRIIADYYELWHAELAIRLLRGKSDDFFTLYDDQGTEIIV